MKRNNLPGVLSRILNSIVAEKPKSFIFFHDQWIYVAPTRCGDDVCVFRDAKRIAADVSPKRLGAFLLAQLNRGRALKFRAGTEITRDRIVHLYHEGESLWEGARLVIAQEFKNRLRVTPHQPRLEKTGPTFRPMPGAKLVDVEDVSLGEAVLRAKELAPIFHSDQLYRLQPRSFAEVARFKDCFVVSSVSRNGDGLLEICPPHFRLPVDVQSSGRLGAAAIKCLNASSNLNSRSRNLNGGRAFLRAAGLKRWSQFHPIGLVRIEESGGQWQTTPLRKEGEFYNQFPHSGRRIPCRGVADLAFQIRLAMAYARPWLD